MKQAAVKVKDYKTISKQLEIMTDEMNGNQSGPNNFLVGHLSCSVSESLVLFVGDGPC